MTLILAYSSTAEEVPHECHPKTSRMESALQRRSTHRVATTSIKTITGVMPDYLFLPRLGKRDSWSRCQNSRCHPIPGYPYHPGPPLQDSFRMAIPLILGPHVGEPGSSSGCFQSLHQGAHLHCSPISRSYFCTHTCNSNTMSDQLYTREVHAQKQLIRLLKILTVAVSPYSIVPEGQLARVTVIRD